MELSKAFIKRVEIEYLRNLSKALRSREINAKDAKESAQSFLKMLPFISWEDMEEKIDGFVKRYQQFAGLLIIVMQYKEETKTYKVLEKMRTLIKSNKIDEALELAK